MGRTRWAALLAGTLVAVGDGWALRHAWGSVGERLVVALGVAALVIGAALGMAPWLHALLGRRPAGAAAAAVVGGLLVGIPLAQTPTVRSLCGAAAPLMTSLGVAASLAALAFLERGPFARAVAAAIGLTNLAIELSLPRRLYPSLRIALLVVGFMALAAALRRRPTAGAPAGALLWARSGGIPGTLAASVLLLLVGRALVDMSANARFVTSAQAPAAGLILDGVTAVKPFARRAPVGWTAPAAVAQVDRSRPRFAVADSLGDAHLVLVTIDALRADRLRPDLMPNLARLAARGVDFRRAYATAPSTAASITSLLTAHHPGRLEGRPPTLAERLRAAGWFTAAFYPAGLFFDGGGPLQPYAEARFGFAWADTRTLGADALTDAVLARVRQLAAESEPRAFLWLHYFDPHEPYDPHELAPGAPAIDRYDAEVRAVDRALARLIDGLARLARPTLVVVTGDHGEEFGEHGGAYHGSSLYEEQLRVPLVVALIGRDFVPEIVTAPASLVDLAPTVSALLDGPRWAADAQPLGATGDLFAAVHTRRMLLRHPWKLIRDERRDLDELYDLEADPVEQHNLADARAGVAATLRAALQQWLNQSSAAELATALVTPSAPAAIRADAARQLGAREAYTGAAALRSALDDADATVRAEAALALAELTDRRARPTLHALLDDPRFADRAAVMLGRLRDPLAAARLQAICRRAPAQGDGVEAARRREAAHYLGFVGDADAVDALLAAAADPRVRGSAYVAIGRIAGRRRDARAATLLRERFAVEDRADARADLAWALGLASDARAVPLLAAAAAADPPLANASEALVRLGALSGGEIGGLDFTCRTRTGAGLDAALDDWLAATTCIIDAPRARYRGRRHANAEVVLVRARAVGQAAQLTLLLDDVPLPPIALGPRFREVLLRRAPAMVEPIGAMVKPIRVEARHDGAPVELDHLLLLRDVTSRAL